MPLGQPGSLCENTVLMSTQWDPLRVRAGEVCVCVCVCVGVCMCVCVCGFVDGWVCVCVGVCGCCCWLLVLFLRCQGCVECVCVCVKERECIAWVIGSELGMRLALSGV